MPLICLGRRRECSGEEKEKDLKNILPFQEDSVVCFPLILFEEVVKYYPRIPFTRERGSSH
jgi:hypothetical protein